MERVSAQGSHLGNLVKTFGPNRANARVLLYIAPVFALVGLIFFLSGFGRSRAADAAAFIIGGIVFLLVAAGAFWGYRRQLTAKADVYEQGFFWKHWRGGQQVVRWEDVNAVYEFIGYDRNQYRAIQWAYTVCMMNGGQVKVNMAVENIRSLGALILKESGQRMLIRMMEAYKAGNAAVFDEEIGFSRQGILSGQRLLPWDQVEKIHFSNRGDLSIHQKAQRLPWKMMIHSRIPNFPVFRTMLHHVAEDLLPGARPIIEDPAYKPS